MRWPNSAATSNVSLLCHLRATLLAVPLCWMCCVSAQAQQATPIGRTSAKEVNVAGAVEVRNGEMLLGNGSAVTAGDQPVNIALTRGGQLRLCSTTAVHLAHDNTINAPDSTALMMSLDRGAIEANYDTGKYSDVLMTPDLRILISGPGHADLKIRVNQRGDTCIDNHGANAPYITVTSQLDGGLYRIHPNQHVTLEHGSLTDVVDTETEPCGCPVAPLSLAATNAGAANSAGAVKTNGGPSSASADTAFPLAQSEGLAPPSAAPTTTPATPHATVSVPLAYSGENPPATPPAAAPTPSTAAQPAVAPVQTAVAPASVTSEPHGFFHRIGHFFSRVFGGN